VSERERSTGKKKEKKTDSERITKKYNLRKNSLKNIIRKEEEEEEEDAARRRTKKMFEYMEEES
jgi:hypothetical protein